MIARITGKSSGMVKLFAPAKINLFLKVTGKRTDGFHEIISVLGKISVGDTLKIYRTNDHSGLRLSCPGYENLESSDNLVAKAVDEWMHESGESWGMHIIISKNIPPMSGLGGGSSDAVTALLGMNELADKKLSYDTLLRLAAKIGSDCPSFLIKGTCVAEGRGEKIRQTKQVASQKLIGRKVLLFRPDLGLLTTSVYTAFSRLKTFSCPVKSANDIKSWEKGNFPIDDLLDNDLEKTVFKKYLYFNSLFELLKIKFGLLPKLSGSGSCSFILLPPNFDDLTSLIDEIRSAWGAETWLQTCEIIN